MMSDPTARLCLFGVPRIEFGELCFDRFPTKRSVNILARLAMAHQCQMSRTHLAETLWPNDDYDESRLRLRQELSRLRRALGEVETVIVSSTEWVRLDMSNLAVDTHEFERLVRASRKAEEPGRREALLRKCVGIASSPFMAGSVEDWIQFERVRLNVDRYGALVELGTLLRDRSEVAEALVFARHAIEIVPDREAAHLLAILCLRDLGHAEDALTQAQVLRRTILRERGGRLSPAAERIVNPEPIDRTDAHVGLRFEAPEPVEPIFGREESLRWVLSHLSPSDPAIRLVTVTGMGGVGKTHLLRHACRELAAGFDGRVAFVDLSNLSEAAGVPTAILRTLGLTNVATDDPVRQLSRVLGAAPAVLSLDNLEQFGGAMAPVIRRLLDEIPALRILAGSRIPINASGERRLPLAPLALPDESAAAEEAMKSPAMELFLHLISTDRSNGKRLPAEDPILANIVRRLEGVPLGLQLAASRMRTLGATALLKDLDEGLSRLVNRREDAPARHHSMRTAVAESFDTLGPKLKAAMASLSIFRGGWTIESAECVCEIRNTEETMARLDDASLILVETRGGGIRFRMLETIREHAHSLLGEPRSLELRDRFVAWMVGRSRDVGYELVDREAKAEFERLEPEMDNLREALRYSLVHYPEAAFELAANLSSFWMFCTNGFEAYQFYRQLFLRQALHPDSSTLLRAAYGHALIAQFVGAADRVLICDRAIRVGRAMGDRSMEIKLRVFQAFTAQDEIRYADCLAYFEEIDQFIAQHGSFESDAFVFRIKGFFILYQGDPGQAIRYYRRAISWFASRGEIFFHTRCRIDLAVAAIDIGDLDLAEAALTGLLDMAYEIRFPWLVALIDGCLGVVAFKRGRYREAITQMERSLRGWQEIGSPYHTGDQWNNLGRVYLREKLLEEAKAAFANAAETWAGDGMPVAVSVAVYGLAATQLEHGDPERAARMFAAGRREFVRAGAKIIRYHMDFIDDLAARLKVAVPHFADLCDGSDELALTLDEAIRLGSVA